MKISRYKVLILLLFLASTAWSEEYGYPIKGVKGLYSASFGEMRPAHFHSGIDIRTEGVEGKAVVAVADGYISRVAVSPTGYGLALYVTHPEKGTMSVYAHLSRLRRDIADYLTEARYKRKQNRITLFPDQELFPVMKGDTIAFSGNSGSSFGPHLHFEVRNIESGHTLNPVQHGIITPDDNIAPKILKLHYIALDSVGYGVKSRLHSSYNVVASDNNSYTLQKAVEIGQRGYFAIEVRDSRNGTTNRFGIYRATMSIDNAPRFEYAINSFDFADTRHCNLSSFYPLQLSAKCEVLRLAKMPLAPQYLYNAALGDGIIEYDGDNRQRISIVVEDECGNSSSLEFSTRFVEEDSPTYDLATMVDLNDKNTHIAERGFSLFIPRGALYETECYNGSIVTDCEIKSDLPILSPIYSIFDEETAFNKAVKARFAVKAPIELQRHLCVATIDGKGELKHLGGYYLTDSVEVVFRRGGDMVVVADTSAPVVTPRFKEGADMRGVKRLSFHVKDNFSGIKHYALYIDNRWRSVDLQPIRGELTHTFDIPLDGIARKRSVRLEVEDRCGNKSVWQGSILK